VLLHHGLRLLPAGQLRNLITRALVERCRALLLPLLSQLLGAGLLQLNDQLAVLYLLSIL
jgi:hypothetical protein